jgi:hypothetical protein
MRRTGQVTAGALAVALALGIASNASAATINGTVVHRNAHAHSFVVAARGGALSTLHARRSPRLGAHVSVRARRLRNGTFAAQRVRVAGFHGRTQIRGTVSYVDAAAGEFTVSDRGASILVHRPRPSRAASAAEALPSVGAEVDVEVSLDGQGDLEETQVEQVGQATTGIELEGTVLSTDVSAETITVSADDEDQTGAGLVVHVPDASQFNAGDEVELVVDGPAADGSYTLSQSSLDGNAHQADTSSGRGHEHQQADSRDGGHQGGDGGQASSQPGGSGDQQQRDASGQQGDSQPTGSGGDSTSPSGGQSGDTHSD